MYSPSTWACACGAPLWKLHEGVGARLKAAVTGLGVQHSSTQPICVGCEPQVGELRMGRSAACGGVLIQRCRAGSHRGQQGSWLGLSCVVHGRLALPRNREGVGFTTGKQLWCADLYPLQAAWHGMASSFWRIWMCGSIVGRGVFNRALCQTTARTEVWVVLCFAPAIACSGGFSSRLQLLGTAAG